MTSRLYIDTNTFISAYESATARADAMLEVLDAVAAGTFHGLTSELTIAELLPKPLLLRQDALVQLYTRLLSGDHAIEVVPVDRTVLLKAAELRASHPPLRLADAIHLATAVTRQCGFMLSDDRRLPSIGPVTVIGLAADTLTRLRRSAP